MNKTLIKFKISLRKTNHTVNSLIYTGALAEQGKNGYLFDSTFWLPSRKLT